MDRTEIATRIATALINSGWGTFQAVKTAVLTADQLIKELEK